LAALDNVLEELMPVVGAMCCAPEHTDDMELALGEALAKAIVHGNEGNPNKKVAVACFCECEADKGLLLVVRDEGPGFDPDAVPDPTASESIYSAHGRGIYLMRQFMDEVEFWSGGREVELRKRGKPECRS
jgi:serine/threonine-protein kinase RsbW